jgi:hypothetical protein
LLALYLFFHFLYILSVDSYHVSAQEIITRGFQDGGKREETESMPPIVKSWTDAGDTPCRQNHREEAKL